MNHYQRIYQVLASKCTKVRVIIYYVYSVHFEGVSNIQKYRTRKKPCNSRYMGPVPRILPTAPSPLRIKSRHEQEYNYMRGYSAITRSNIYMVTYLIIVYPACMIEECITDFTLPQKHHCTSFYS